MFFVRLRFGCLLGLFGNEMQNEYYAKHEMLKIKVPKVLRLLGYCR